MAASRQGDLVVSKPQDRMAPSGLPGPRPSVGQVLSAFFYSCSGGFADATAFLFAGSFAGHITGNLVLLSISGSTGRWLMMLRPLVAIVTFLAATEMGLMLTKRAGARWIVLLAQCAIICSLVLSPLRHCSVFDLVVVLTFSFSLGLQNGVVSSVDGVVVHSSYMTGTATRILKTLLANARPNVIHQVPAGGATVMISAAVIAGFCVGAATAAGAHAAFGAYSPLFLCLPLFAASLFCSRS